jgi:hypothetical protein
MTEPFHPSDAPSDEQLALSEALDGSATAEQLALVDASPELGRQLAELAVARTEMAAVEVPASAREAGLAAALAVFDEMHSAPATATAPTNVVAFTRRRTWYRGVMAAAAAAIIVVAGVATLANLGGGSDDDQATTAELDTSAKSSAAPSDAETMIATAPAGADDAADSATPAPTSRTESAGGAAETTAAASADTTTVETIGEIGGPAIVDLPDEDALRQWASSADVREGDSTCGSTDDEPLGLVSYQGRQVVVTRDPGTGELFVYDAGDCSPVTTVAG